MAALWAVEILPSAERELHSLPDQAYYRNRYKVRFYKGRYRFRYDVSEQQGKVIVGRIRIRDAETYSGMDRW